MVMHQPQPYSAPANFALATENSSLKYVNEFRPTANATQAAFNFMPDLSQAQAFKPTGYVFVPTKMTSTNSMPYNPPNSSHCGFNMSDQHMGTFVASSCQNTRSDGSVSEFIPSSFAQQNRVQTNGKSPN